MDLSGVLCFFYNKTTFLLQELGFSCTMAVADAPKAAMQLISDGDADDENPPDGEQPEHDDSGNNQYIASIFVLLSELPVTV